MFEVSCEADAAVTLEASLAGSAEEKGERMKEEDFNPLEIIFAIAIITGCFALIAWLAG